MDDFSLSFCRLLIAGMTVQNQISCSEVTGIS